VWPWYEDSVGALRSASVRRHLLFPFGFFGNFWHLLLLLLLPQPAAYCGSASYET